MILVTGATGFIGGQLVRRLVADGAAVRILVRSRRKAESQFGSCLADLEVAEGDLNEPASLTAAVAGVAQVYHCASWISYRDPWAQVHRVNVAGTRHLLDACLAAGVQRVLHISSIAAGGPARRMDSGSYAAVHESAQPRPLDDPYGRTKLEQEQVALSYNGRGLAVVVVRPSAVFGPGDPEGINLLLRLIMKSRLPFYLGDRKTPVNVVYIADVVAGSIVAMAKGGPGEVYNLVGPNLTHAELFRILARVSGGREPRVTAPISLLLGAAWLVAQVARPFGRPPVHPNDVRSWTAPWLVSGEKARTDLGLVPTDLTEAWRRTLVWLQEGETA